MSDKKTSVLRKAAASYKAAAKKGTLGTRAQETVKASKPEKVGGSSQKKKSGY
jgi:hypothetical protein